MPAVGKAAWGCCNILSVGDLFMFNKEKRGGEVIFPSVVAEISKHPCEKGSHTLIDLTSRGQSSCQWDPIWRDLCFVVTVHTHMSNQKLPSCIVTMG